MSAWDLRQIPTAQLPDKPAATETIGMLWGQQAGGSMSSEFALLRFCQHAPGQKDVDLDTLNHLHELLSNLPGLGLKRMKA